MVPERKNRNMMLDDWVEAEQRTRDLLQRMGTELQWWQTTSARLREQNSSCKAEMSTLEDPLHNGSTITKALDSKSPLVVQECSPELELAETSVLERRPQQDDSVSDSPVVRHRPFRRDDTSVQLASFNRPPSARLQHLVNMTRGVPGTHQISGISHGSVSVATDSPPTRWGKATAHVRHVLESHYFEMLIGCLIFLNTMVMAAEMQYYGLEAGYQAEFPDYNNPAHEVWPGGDKIFILLERIFTVIFTVELFVRIVIFGRRLFMVPFNWIDIFSVVVGLVDWMLEGQIGLDPKIARLLRLAKLARGLRLANISRVMDSLHLLLKCMAASVSVLSWSVFLLLLVQCIVGMILSQLVRDIIVDPDEDLEARQKIFSYYGTFSRSQITMFEVNLANFAPACRILVDYCGEWYAAVFLAYRCLAGYAILNVINAVFVQQTIQMAQRDHDVMIRNQEKQAKTITTELKHVFSCLDSTGDGLLSYEELLAVEEQPELKHWLNALDIDTSDLDSLFRLLDTDGDGEVTFDEFFQGAIRMKGTAKSADMLTILRQLRRMNQKMQALIERDLVIERHISGTQTRTTVPAKVSVEL